MNKFASFIQATRLKQLAIVFFAGVMLMVTTACSGAAQARMPADTAVGGTVGETVGRDGGPNPVNQVQPYKGGMNNFDDTPPEQMRPDKAKALVDNAQSNIDNKARTPKIVDKAKELGQKVQQSADNVSDNVAGAGENAKYNAKTAGSSIEGVVNDAKRAVKNAID
ncbi:MAG TPA: DUF6658 family protein [Leptolyngbya sp.]|jgi:hypothetical protein|nr:DUF6658 family protein [Leptolyngbya sp.]